VLPKVVPPHRSQRSPSSEGGTAAEDRQVRFPPPKAWDPEAKWTQECMMFRVWVEKHPPVRCNDIPPPRWRLNGRWYCAFPEIRDCVEPGRIPMKPIAIDDIKL
jgi:hypothetical protein